jgi:hypothetical protein
VLTDSLKLLKQTNKAMGFLKKLKVWRTRILKAIRKGMRCSRFWRKQRPKTTRLEEKSEGGACNVEDTGIGVVNVEASGGHGCLA